MSNDASVKRGNPKEPLKLRVNNKSEEKSGEMLAGAMQEFVKHGYAAASMDRIAVASGVSKPTLYSYFRDKAGLFAALVQSVVKDGRRIELTRDEQILQLPLRDSLKRIAHSLLENSSGKQPFFTLIRLLIGESGRFPFLAQTFVRNVTKPALEDLTYLLANHPDINVSDPEVIARCFHGSVISYILLQEVMHGQEVIPLESERMVDGLVDLICSLDQPHRSDELDDDT